MQIIIHPKSKGMGVRRRLSFDRLIHVEIYSTFGDDYFRCAKSELVLQNRNCFVNLCPK
jgi:hypothetical protein